MKKDRKKNEFQENELSQDNCDSSETSMASIGDWSEDKFVWDKQDLEKVNKLRENKDVMPLVVRNKYQIYGVRAHGDMGTTKSAMTIFMPHCNEFISIWLYLVFAVYFWVESVLIITKYKDYEFEDFSYDYFYMYIATFGIAFSLTLTTLYLIFYAISEKSLKIWESIHFQGLLVMFYFFLFAYIVSEYTGASLYFYTLFTIGCLLLTALLAAIYGVPKWIIITGTAVFLFFILLIDWIYHSSKKTVKVFYLPVLIETGFLAVGIILWAFNIPERWTENRIVHLYVNSFVLFTLIFVSFIFEMHNILYCTLLLN